MANPIELPRNACGGCGGGPYRNFNCWPPPKSSSVGAPAAAFFAAPFVSLEGFGNGASCSYATVASWTARRAAASSSWLRLPAPQLQSNRVKKLITVNAANDFHALLTPPGT